MWRAVVWLATLVCGASGTIFVYSQDRMIAEEFRDMPASFGPVVPADGLSGLTVRGQPEDGCTALAKPPPDENTTGHWIVVVARFNCTFEEKVRNAQAAGYHCVIVHNVNSSDLETMFANNSEGIAIPSVFVGDVAGILLADEYNYTSGFFVIVNGELPFNINTHLLLPFAIVVVLCLLVILIFMIVKCIKDRRRARRHRLPNRCLKKIPTCKFSKGDPYDTCAICLDDYLEGDRLRVLPCAHAYHAKCVDPWLTKNRRVCPVCKRKVLAAGERRPRRDSDSDSDDDTEPLVATTPRTQGGTFDEQSENPFVRAARFMQRLRPNRDRPVDEVTQEAPPSDENTQGDENANDEHPSSDTAPLIPAPRLVARTESERRRRRQRGTPRPPSSTPIPAAHQPSINADSRGEIGVAALPAPREGATGPPPHIHL